MLPEHHHGDVLGVGQVDLVQKGLVALDDLPRAGVQREAQLVLQLQAVVIHSCALAKAAAFAQSSALGLPRCSIRNAPGQWK